MKTSNVKPGTSTPAAADTSRGAPEYCRISDLDRLFGIRRGTAYNLIASGAINAKLVRVTGSASGVRLISVASVRDYIESQPDHSNRDGMPTS